MAYTRHSCTFNKCDSCFFSNPNTKFRSTPNIILSNETVRSMLNDKGFHRGQEV